MTLMRERAAEVADSMANEMERLCSANAMQASQLIARTIRALPDDDPNPTRAALEECAASLLETMTEAKEHLRNIVEAKAEDFRGLDDPRFKAAYDQETARMEAIVRRAEHAYATARKALQETEK